MSFEQPVYSFSYPSGEPPTPTKTPTSPNFFLNSFQTPKQDSRSHGLYSPWSPSSASAASPDFKTPTCLSFATPSKTPTKSSRISTGQDFETELATHVHRLSPNPSLPLPLVEPSRQLTSSPNPSLTSETKRRRLGNTGSSVTPLKTTLDQETGRSMNSAGSMQTPPPTSTSASRRKAQQAQAARLVKESAEKGRRMSFPSLAKTDNMGGSTSQVEESQNQFSALQFSPEGFEFPMSGPATAPTYPAHKLFWDPEQSGDDMNLDFPMGDTFTAFGIQKNMDPFASDHAGGGISFPTSPAFSLLGTRAENVAPFAISSQADAASHPATSISMARKSSRGIAVNPSLLFSSPRRAAEASSMPATSQIIQDDNLLPYAHQLRDAQMEMEMQMQNTRKPKRKRGPETDSPAVKAALQTLRDDQIGVSRDLVDSIVAQSDHRRPSSRNSSGRLKTSQATGQRPLQKQRSNGRLHKFVSAPQPQKRTSVTLTIDANGRAKTETRIVADDGGHPGSQMEVDSDDDSDSTSSSSDTGMTISQPQSFAYPVQKQKQPKLGRFAHNPQSHSQKSSYASTLGSSSNARTMSEATSRRPSSSLYMQSNSPSTHSRAPSNFRGGEEVESEADTVIDSDDDRGDAQSALKKVLQSRSQKNASKRSMTGGSKSIYTEPRRAYPSTNASTHPYKMNDSLTPTRGYNEAYNNNISPTTITDPDLATPSTGHSNISSDSVRCLCQTSEDDGQLMIQCESCRKWQHVSCLGLPLDRQKLPAVHLCVFCTATPNVRGGRVREPARAAFPPPSSPLAHKSHRYR